VSVKRRIRIQVIENPLVEAASIVAVLGRRFLPVQAQPEVAIVDRNSTRGDTAALVRNLRFDGARVLVLASSPPRELIGEALRAGAEGFLARMESWRELVAAVRALAEGRNVYGPEVAAAFADGNAAILHVIDGQAWDLDPVRTHGNDARGGEAPMLSPREAQILQLVATGQSNAAMAQTLHISAHTVRKHRENLMAKLGLHNVAEVAAFAVRNNLIAPPPAGVPAA